MKQEFDLEKLHQLFKVVDGNLIRKVTTSSRSKAGDVAGCLTKKGYLQVRFDGKTSFVHRIVWALCNNKNIPDGFEIDHIDRCKTNNHIENLRLATRSQNATNRESKKKYKNVYFEKERNLWRASCTIEKKVHRIGRFKTEVEAAKAYDDFVASKSFEFAIRNF